MKTVITFGELMLRLAPNGYYRFFQNDQMQATFGGGEANVAVSLANYGLHSTYVTKLPKHAIGQAAVDSLRYFGVDTDEIVRGGDRVGIYFLEKGASQRGSVCIYDRAHSAIAEAKASDFDWDAIFDGADWFHFTGITPALGGDLVDICLLGAWRTLLYALPSRKPPKEAHVTGRRVYALLAWNADRAFACGCLGRRHRVHDDTRSQKGKGRLLLRLRSLQIPMPFEARCAGKRRKNG